MFTSGGGMIMLFDKKKERRKSRHCKTGKRRKMSSSFHKLVFFAGATLMLKGLKGWIKSKKKMR